MKKSLENHGGNRWWNGENLLSLYAFPTVIH